MTFIQTDELTAFTNDGALVVRFTRPEMRNPLSIAVLLQLNDIVDHCLIEKDVIALIFTGTADVFASGADLREIAAVTPEGAREFAHRGQDLMTKIAALPQLTIAAVNGFCFGGALDMALACDERIASPNAVFCHPGSSLGIMTGWGGTQRLLRLVGEARALDMFFTAEPVGAGDALAIGLVDEVSGDPLERALEIVRNS
jgi:enoyl-CoA hydratase